MSRISSRFTELRKDGMGALICYIMGGYPSIDFTVKLIPFLANCGADIIEVGIPFSDPIADGRSIQNASVKALASGATPIKVIDAIAEARKKTEVPVLTMTYFNIIYKLGVDNFLHYAARHGVDGVIVPDLPVDEAIEFCDKAKGKGVDTVFLASPTTTEDRLQRVVRLSTGFVYLVSLLGVTGARREVSSRAFELIKRVKVHTKGRLPLAVGFGISKPEHVAQLIRSGADGVVVGSALIDLMEGSTGDRIIDNLARFVTSMKKAAKRDA
ncbi:MAG: tryptophan synthase subunit alpha [Conexivisphaerales archaeon]